jgi:hypothetical protein
LPILPPESVLRNPAPPMVLHAGPVALTMRSSDRLLPAWGGDVYFRLDVDSGTRTERPQPRDLVVVMDTRDRGSLARQRRFATSVFSTMRSGDHGALISTAEGSEVLVPLLPFAGLPLLLQRTDGATDVNNPDLGTALERAVGILSGENSGRARRLIVLSSSAAILDHDTREWLSRAAAMGIHVDLVPLAVGAAVRFEQIAAATHANALAEVRDAIEEETNAIATVAAMPSLQTLADRVVVSLESVPGPVHLLEVYGANAVWTPSGGEVPIGTVFAGDARTLVLRSIVPPWRDGGDFELHVRVTYHDGSGDHEVRQSMHATYSGVPSIQSYSRSGDILQYASLLTTLAHVQYAIAHGDSERFGALRDPAMTQAQALLLYARSHNDEIMAEQATLLRQLIEEAPLGWQAAAQ